MVMNPMDGNYCPVMTAESGEREGGGEMSMGRSTMTDMGGDYGSHRRGD